MASVKKLSACRGNGMDFMDRVKSSGIEIRHQMFDNQIWIAGNDIVKAMGWENPRVPLSRYVDISNKMKMEFPTKGGTQVITAINEAGCYQLALKSKAEWAKVFRDNLAEKLPSLRQDDKSSLVPMGDCQRVDMEQALAMAQAAIEIGSKMEAGNVVGIAVDLVRKTYGVDLKKVFQKRRVAGREYHNYLEDYVNKFYDFSPQAITYYADFINELRKDGTAFTCSAVSSYLSLRFKKIRVKGKVAYVGLRPKFDEKKVDR